MAEAPLVFLSAEAERLEPRLPPSSATSTSSEERTLPWVTLTFATSLDSALSLGPGIRTALSGPQSKAMTHYLRSRHDAICVGVGTAIADDPGLNCRLAASSQGPTVSPDAGSLPGSASAITTHQPRPIVIDPMLRWEFTSQSKVMQLAGAGKGLAPYIITAVAEPPGSRKKLLEEVGGKYIVLDQPNAKEPTAGAGYRRFDWRAILAAVRNEGMQSIMIEGGGEVINSLLSAESAELVDSVIITIAPTWLGPGSVFVSPPLRPTGPPDQTSLIPGPTSASKQTEAASAVTPDGKRRPNVPDSLVEGRPVQASEGQQPDGKHGVEAGDPSGR
ncbi:Uu.00g017020.m01.CDS01 [Anthostomella pinea]|uniref:2,5-diamino-6-ribosylamino-4(3H)-pyrimidinone 5'-phosphate reductase n=1 Tax=Anthostomella pinea TaxID=933095 RepID=A0AAI8VYU0_9PEZI|nr:Uu.00g017020.m01.CDS01 [Anthostomella pinea]